MSGTSTSDLLAEDQAILDRAELARARLAAAEVARENSDAARAERVAAAREVYDARAPQLEKLYSDLLHAQANYLAIVEQIRGLRPIVESAHGLLASAGDDVGEMPRRISVRCGFEPGKNSAVGRFRGAVMSDI